MSGGELGYWARRRRISRRTALRSSFFFTVGAGAVLTVGCGDDDDDSEGGSTPASSTGTQAAATPKPGGDLVVVWNAAEPVLDPALSRTGGDPPILWMLYDNLVANDRQGLADKNASLAQNWEIVDGTRFNFTLRPGITFHDGTPLNAEAVKFNFDRVLDPATNSQYRGQIGANTKVSVSGDNVISLDLAAPDAALLTQLGDRAGMIASPTAVMKSPADFGLNPVGSGPFQFGSWVKGSHLIVKKNPTYWGKSAAGAALPYLDSVRFNFIADATVGLANLESGSAHVVNVPSSDFQRISGSDKYRVSTLVGVGNYGAYLNNSIAPMDDEHFRKAVAYAIDKKAVIAAMTAGQGKESIGPIGPTSWAYDESVKGYPYGLEAAKKELAMSKYPQGADLPAITFTSPDYKQEAELWEQMLKPLNINLKTEAGATAAIVDRMFTVKDSPLFVASHSMRPDPSGVIGDNLRSDSFYNSGRRPNPELDALIDKARQSYDTNERKRLYSEVQQKAIDQVWQFIYSFYSVLNVATPKSVQGMDGAFSTDGKPLYRELWLSS